MIAFDYQLSAAWNLGIEQENLASLDEMALRYDLLLGDIIIQVDSRDMSARWDWVPILDFAASLRRISVELAKHEVDIEFEFTESDAKLCFAGVERVF